MTILHLEIQVILMLANVYARGAIDLFKAFDKVNYNALNW